MIQLTINFSSVEAAIVALDKLRAAPAPKDKPSAPASPAAPSAPAAARTQRVEQRPKRKYTRKNAAGESPASETAAPIPPTAGAQAPAAPEPEAADKLHVAGDPLPGDRAAASASEDEAKSAMEALYEAKGIGVARATLSRFGAKRVSELLPEARAKFIAKAKAVIGGEAV